MLVAGEGIVKAVFFLFTLKKRNNKEGKGDSEEKKNLSTS